MIFYFSATANSRYVAEKISKEWDMDMVDMAKAMRKKAFTVDGDEDEIVFFVFPVYFWGLPKIVKQFLQELDFHNAKGAKVCGVITCGSSIGGADRMFRKALRNKPCEVKAVYKVAMPDNCVVFFNIPTRQQQIMILRKSDKAIEGLINDIRFHFRNGYRSNLVQNLFTKAVYTLYETGRSTKKFRVQDSCIGCGLCQTICPDEVIVMEEGRPVWTQKQCTWCLGCINRCPVEAIQYGKKTEGRGRYVNPNMG